MSFTKSIKKNISSLFPKGIFKEKLKRIWYNIISNKKVTYKFAQKEDSSLLYETKYEDLTFFTNEPLYSITPDFDNYEYFYKVKPGDIVIDGGANVGILSLLYSKKSSKGGHVYCFEPDKYNIDKLKSNFKLNKDSHNYSIHDELIWSEETLVDFQESGTVASSALWFSSKDNIVKKKTITLDNWCEENKIEQLDFIKMDIEGAELEAVKGCENIMKKYQPNFAIASYHLVDGESTYIKLEAFFKRMNYPCITKKFSGYEIITFAGPMVLSQNLNN